MHHRPHGAKPCASLNTSRIIYTLGYQQPAENIMKAENKKKARRGKKNLRYNLGMWPACNNWRQDSPAHQRCLSGRDPDVATSPASISIN